MSESRAKRCPSVDSSLAQLAEVVDLAVEGQREAGGGVAHRLTRPVRVDDRQPPVPEKHLVSGAGAAKARTCPDRPARDGRSPAASTRACPRRARSPVLQSTPQFRTCWPSTGASDSELRVAYGGEPAPAYAVGRQERGVRGRHGCAAEGEADQRSTVVEIRPNHAPGERRGERGEQQQQAERAPVLQAPERNAGEPRDAPQRGTDPM